MNKLQLPNELLAQMDGKEKDFYRLTKQQQRKEIEWAIERCYMRMQEEFEDLEQIVYCKKQIILLNKLLKTIKKE